MSTRELVDMSVLRLQCVYAEAVEINDEDLILKINTIRIFKMIRHALEVFPKEELEKGIVYYNFNGEAYFGSEKKVKPSSLTLQGFIESLILIYINSQKPVQVDMSLMRSLVGEKIKFIAIEVPLEPQDKRLGLR